MRGLRIASGAMPDSMHLVVPVDLGMELIAEGFDEPFRGRDGGLVSDAVAATLTIAGTIVALGADTITLLVGTGEIWVRSPLL